MYTVSLDPSVRWMYPVDVVISLPSTVQGSIALYDPDTDTYGTHSDEIVVTVAGSPLTGWSRWHHDEWMRFFLPLKPANTARTRQRLRCFQTDACPATAAQICTSPLPLWTMGLSRDFTQ